ncbi:MAG: DNA polymerase Y family protein [Paracoccaceae bacterium]|nr:DNA polymerase Y family protein [Paracoccaceae bacterium]
MPRNRRILSLWFPRLAAERAMRLGCGVIDGPFAVVATTGSRQTLASLNTEAEAQGLFAGQALRDALACCPGLATQPADPVAEVGFLERIARWAGKFTPLVALDTPDALMLDISGCAHLFGGEEGLATTLRDNCAALGLSARIGLADTPGAAWALARFAGRAPRAWHSGDRIRQEARATRSRAQARPNRPAPVDTTAPPAIAPPGQMRSALARLPVEALRLPPDAVAGLTRLGIRHIGDLAGLPRASVARRFGRDVVLRLDQALGVTPEPIGPLPPETRFAVRLTLPDPIGLDADIMAAIDRLLPALCGKLARHGRGARQIRLEFHRTDRTRQNIAIGLARAMRAPDNIRPLILLKLTELDAGFGIDMIRLMASATEPLHDHQHAGHAEARAAVSQRLSGKTALNDLISRLGARIGLEAITRLHPADSHIPEKTATVMGAAWSAPAPDWPLPPTPRPLVLFAPEIVMAPETSDLPLTFRWRRRNFTVAGTTGPERIAPEWWLNDPAWRSGIRDYWQVATSEGPRLWLFRAHGGLMSGGWFCHGVFD